MNQRGQRCSQVRPFESDPETQYGDVHGQSCERSSCSLHNLRIQHLAVPVGDSINIACRNTKFGSLAGEVTSCLLYLPLTDVFYPVTEFMVGAKMVQESRIFSSPSGARNKLLPSGLAFPNVVV